MRKLKNVLERRPENFQKQIFYYGFREVIFRQNSENQ